MASILVLASPLKVGWSPRRRAPSFAKPIAAISSPNESKIGRYREKSDTSYSKDNANQTTELCYLTVGVVSYEYSTDSEEPSELLDQALNEKEASPASS